GEATDTPLAIWTITFTVMGIALLFFPSFYKVMEKLMLTLVLLMLGCFIGTLFLADIDVGKAIGGLSPTIPSGSLGLVIAFTASCFSLVGAFYQTYLDRKSTRLNSSHVKISYAVFCLKKKKKRNK